MTYNYTENDNQNRPLGQTEPVNGTPPSNSSWYDYGTDDEIEGAGLISEGNHALRVEDIEKGRSKSSGDEMWTIIVSCPEEPQASKARFWQTFPAPGTKPFVIKNMKDLFDALDLTKYDTKGSRLMGPDVPTETVIGKLFNATIYHEDNGDFGKQARVKGYKKYEGPGFGDKPSSEGEIPF